MRRIDLTGQKFNRLLVIKPVGSKWLCKCDCGKETLLYCDNLKSGHTRSCGCLIRDTNRKHGHAHDENGKQSRTYKAWVNLNSRVTGFTENHRKHYTDRGITVCSAWRTSFTAFLNDMGECPPKLTLERIDNDGNYEPGNCRWATQAEQCVNTTKTHKVILNKKTVCLKDACAYYSIPYLTAISRVKKGMTPQQAIDFALVHPGMPSNQRAAIALSVSKSWVNRS